MYYHCTIPLLKMVTSTGFGPVNAAVKGRCVKPLHQLATQMVLIDSNIRSDQMQDLFFYPDHGLHSAHGV